MGDRTTQRSKSSTSGETSSLIPRLASKKSPSLLSAREKYLHMRW